MNMKNSAFSFILRMATVFFALCTIVSLQAYAQLRLSTDLLAAPACALLAYFFYQAELMLHRPAKKRPVLRITSKKARTVHAA